MSVWPPEDIGAAVDRMRALKERIDRVIESGDDPEDLIDEATEIQWAVTMLCEIAQGWDY